ncbi:MAG: hypothetical protein ACRC1R_00745 [Cetobacterium sp.]|uniref:hypothetical protein n=1 Tax=Cetobacterium sp. TaxID=2071632 RepID=UPI002FC89232
MMTIIYSIAIIILILIMIYNYINTSIDPPEEEVKNEKIKKILKDVPTLKEEKLNELNLESLEKIINRIEEKKRKEIEKEILLEK